MSIPKLSKFFLSAFLAIFVLSIIGTVWAQTTIKPLEVEYPDLPGNEGPKSLRTFLPKYIQYIYRFVVMAGGLIALLVLITGGFRYLTSAGNPSVMTDSRNQIFAGLIGLIVIFGSYILLNELNSELVALRPPGINPIGRGIVIYSDNNCGGQGEYAGVPGLIAEIDDDVNFVKLEATQSIDPQDVGSFFSFNSGHELTQIKFYQAKDCTGRAELIVPNGLTIQANHNHTLPRTLKNIQCIEMKWHIPGVWLFSYENGDPRSPDSSKGYYDVFGTDQEFLPKHLSDNVKSIALVPDTENSIDYGVILHNLEGRNPEEKGFSLLYLPNNEGPGKINKFNINSSTVGGLNNPDDISSITIFRIDKTAPDNWIEICRNPDCKSQCVTEKGETKCYDASIIFQWNELPKEIMKGIARAAVITKKDGKEGGSQAEWWKNGDKIVMCDNIKDPWNWVGRAAKYFGKCARGVSSIQVEPGSRYLIIAYNDEGGYNSNFRGNRNALTTSGNIGDMAQFYANDETGMIFVIKTMSESY